MDHSVDLSIPDFPLIYQYQIKKKKYKKRNPAITQSIKGLKLTEFLYSTWAHAFLIHKPSFTIVHQEEKSRILSAVYLRLAHSKPHLSRSIRLNHRLFVTTSMTRGSIYCSHSYMHRNQNIQTGLYTYTIHYNSNKVHSLCIQTHRLFECNAL